MLSDGQGSCTTQPQQQGSDHKHGGGPGGEDAKTGPRADGQATEIGRGLDGEPSAHRPGLPEQAQPVGIADCLGDDGDKVEKAEDNADASCEVQRGGDAEAEQGDQDQVADRPDSRAQRGPVGQGQGRVAAGRAAVNRRDSAGAGGCGTASPR